MPEPPRLPRLHARESMVTRAQLDLAECIERLDGVQYAELIAALVWPFAGLEENAETTAAIAEWQKAHPDLTVGETLRCIAHQLAWEARYMIRMERHGDATKRGGEE